MRDYTNSNRTDVKKFLRDAYNSTDRDYRDPYFYQSVPYNRRNLKYDSMCVGSDANSHIRSIRNRVDNALTVLNEFYASVDTTSSNIAIMANKIVGILDEVNSSMERINSALSELGDYKGKRVTADDIRSAGIDLSKCTKLKDEYFDAFMNDDEAVALYIEEMKALQAKDGNIPPEDMAKLNKIYSWYVDNRFGPTGNVNDMDEQTLKNCIDVYELIDPNAKEVTEKFFSSAYELNNEDVNLNVLKIKYGIYTCDPLYRDTILGYLPHMELNALSSGSGASCSNSTDKDGNKLAILNLDLYEENSGNFCSFFHECGHGVDYLSGEPSKNLPTYIIEDVRNELRKTIEEYNATLPIDKRLSQDGIDQLLDYFLNTTCNPNVVFKNGDAPALPEEWCPELKDAYVYVRDQ